MHRWAAGRAEEGAAAGQGWSLASALPGSLGLCPQPGPFEGLPGAGLQLSSCSKTAQQQLPSSGPLPPPVCISLTPQPWSPCPEG